MASSISSLGLGSDGALSYDVIDQLRAVDEKAQITPIDTKLESNATKQKDLSILTTMAATLKSSTSSLSDEMSYLKRTSTVSNSAVSVSAASGSGIQDFSLHVTQLAKRDVYQSSGFASESTALGLASGTLTITVNGSDYEIDVDSTTTLTQLKEKINDTAGTKVTASVLNVGGTDPQKLVIKSDETGEENAISFSATDNAILTSLGLDDVNNHIQTAKNAKFTYNNVAIERSSNTIEDLVVGLSITLNEEQDLTENTTVSITQNTDEIKSALESFVSAYNDLISNLSEATKYDTETKTAGTFQGVSQISALSSEIRRQLLSLDDAGRSLSDYGLALNEGGTLEFDTTVFDEAIRTNADDIESFFRGSTNEDGELSNGFFTDFNELLARYVTGEESILSLYQSSLSGEKTSLSEERKTTLSRLDARYETMATRFASYDSIINKLNNQFSALSQMIEASYKND